MAEPLTKLPDSEKMTINLGMVDLGRIDLLVSEGFYANRTDLIRTAIRNQLQRHEGVLDRLVARRDTDLGLRHVGVADLEAVKRREEMIDLRVLGLLSIADEVSPDLALATIRSVHVLGAFHASPAVKAALSARTR